MTYQVLEGDCLDVMRGMDAESVDAIVTDPPYGLEFMGKEWDRLAGDFNADARIGKNGRDDGRNVPMMQRPTPRYHAGYAAQAWHEAWAREALRVLKPGGHLLAFGGTRTYHRLVCAIEDAGFEVRDTVQWIYGSGFPKSLNVGKAIDKMGHDQGGWRRFAKAYAEAVDVSTYSHSDIDKHLGIKSSSCYWVRTDHRGGLPPRHHWEKVRDLLGLNGDFEKLYEAAEREVLGKSSNGLAPRWVENGDAGYKGEFDITAPATEAAEQWDGWGTALKPAHEPIVLARKPLAESSVARQVLSTGTGALNVDASRIRHQSAEDAASAVPQGRATSRRKPNTLAGGGQADPRYEFEKKQPPGRWPANLLLSHSSLPIAVLSSSIPLEAKTVIEEYFDGYDKVQVLRERQRGLSQRDPQGARGILLPEVQGRVPGDANGRKGAAPREAAHREDESADSANAASEGPQRPDGATPVMEGRGTGKQGLQVGSHRPVQSGARGDTGADVEQRELPPRAPGGDGGSVGTPANVRGNGTPPQRPEDGQPTGESGGPKEGAAFTASPGDDYNHRSPDRREPTLEILARDMPLQWGHYFELTGEDLGCRRTGEVRRVKASTVGTNKEKPYGDERVWSTSNTPGRETTHHADPDGTEAVEAWECQPDCPVRLMDEQSGHSTPSYRKTRKQNGNPGMFGISSEMVGHNDSGGASRFFQRVEGSPEPGFQYVAKASRRERNGGLEGMPEQVSDGKMFNSKMAKRGHPEIGKPVWSENKPREPMQNSHPTVKPITLMRYLVRLITPPGGTVLDPFAGSGSTGCAAVLEGFGFIGIEREPEYAEIARRRIAHWSLPEEARANGKGKSSAKRSVYGLASTSRIPRCPEHGESFTTASNVYKCGCPFVWCSQDERQQWSDEKPEPAEPLTTLF